MRLEDQLDSHFFILLGVSVLSVEKSLVLSEHLLLRRSCAGQFGWIMSDPHTSFEGRFISALLA